MYIHRNGEAASPPPLQPLFWLKAPNSQSGINIAFERAKLHHAYYLICMHQFRPSVLWSHYKLIGFSQQAAEPFYATQFVNLLLKMILANPT